jgi:virginiamycin B lyase
VVAAAAVLVFAAPPADAVTPIITTIPVPTLDGTPVGITSGSGGIWYTDPASGLVGRVNADDSITEFPVEIDAAPTAITAGPDGALWFTEPGIDAIGRMTPVGVATDYPLPAAGGAPAGVAAGPDGNVWFSLREGDPLGSVNAATGLATYPLAATPSAITLGPDGALWGIDIAANAIRRIDVATRAVTTHTLPAGVGPVAITSGTDGALWFTMRLANAIGRLTTSGVLTTYPLTDASANPTAIASAPDGAIWFSETNADRVGRFADGVIETFAVGDGPRGITVDAGGDAWVALGDEGAIARVSLPSAGPSDTTAPTIAIASPATASWGVLGSGGLVADYGCTDETGLVLCEGTVADGSSVLDTALGSHVFSVHAEDAAGNTADASVPYLVFGSVEGSLATGGSAHGPWESVTLGMDLARGGADPVSLAEMTVVDCDSGDPLGGAVATSVRTRVTPSGDLEVRWRPGSGTGCATLTLWFTAAGWQDVPATFGPVPL